MADTNVPTNEQRLAALDRIAAALMAAELEARQIGETHLANLVTEPLRLTDKAAGIVRLTLALDGSLKARRERQEAALRRLMGQRVDGAGGAVL